MSDEYDPFLDELRLIAGRPMYYDRQGEPITLRQWSNIRFDPANIIVAKTVTKAGEVSTVWLGLNHAFLPGPPQVFETMVFELEWKDGPFGPVPQDVGDICERYATEEEALHGHLRIVEELGGPVDDEA